ncbi:MAG: acyl carrier protein [Lachnospiraceae bacterium]|nr:acyl carrier protein [Lachnospiraceae bacterium]
MREELLEIISEVTGHAPDRIDIDKPLYEYIDEFDMGQIIVDVEDAFGIEITDEDMIDWIYVKDMIEYIENEK